MGAVLVATVLGGAGCVSAQPGASAGASDGCARAVVLTVDPRIHLTGICGAEPTAPVCADAAAKGLDANWSGR